MLDLWNTAIVFHQDGIVYLLQVVLQLSQDDLQLIDFTRQRAWRRITEEQTELLVCAWTHSVLCVFGVKLTRPPVRLPQRPPHVWWAHERSAALRLSACPSWCRTRLRAGLDTKKHQTHSDQIRTDMITMIHIQQNDSKLSAEWDTTATE